MRRRPISTGILFDSFAVYFIMLGNDNKNVNNEAGSAIITKKNKNKPETKINPDLEKRIYAFIETKGAPFRFDGHKEEMPSVDSNALRSFVGATQISRAIVLYMVEKGYLYKSPVIKGVRRITKRKEFLCKIGITADGIRRWKKLSDRTGGGNLKQTKIAGL